MILSMSDELVIFLWSVLSGIFIAFTYDIFSIARNTDKFSILVCNICDGVFITCASTIMIFILFSVSNGYVRFFEFAGAFIGGILYKLTLSRIVLTSLKKIIHIFFKLFKVFFKILLTPLKLMYKIIYNTISVLCVFIRRLLFPIRVKSSNHFKNLRQALKKS